MKNRKHPNDAQVLSRIDIEVAAVSLLGIIQILIVTKEKIRSVFRGNEIVLP